MNRLLLVVGMVLEVMTMVSHDARASTPVVRMLGGVHTQVGHAARRLEGHLQTLPELPSDAEVVLVTKDNSVANAGEGGYRLRSVSPNRIEVMANTDAGGANYEFNDESTTSDDTYNVSLVVVKASL